MKYSGKFTTKLIALRTNRYIDEKFRNDVWGSPTDDVGVSASDPNGDRSAVADILRRSLAQKPASYSLLGIVNFTLYILVLWNHTNKLKNTICKKTGKGGAIVEL